MASGGSAYAYMPSGEQLLLPAVPTAYTDQVAAPSASAAQGSRLTATELANDMTAGVTWLASRPFFVGYQGTAESIPNATWTPITLDTEQIDNYQGHSDSANPSRWYPPNSNNIAFGFHDYYLVTGLVRYNSASTADFIAGVRLTGGTVQEGQKTPSIAASNAGCFVADIMEVTAATDYIELMGWQSTGAAVNTNATPGRQPYLIARWVGTNRWATQPLPGTPHTWADIDQVTATATGASPKGGVKVPLQTELNSYLTFQYGRPVARLTSQGTTATIPSTTASWTTIPFPTQSIDNYSGWSSGANTKYTVQRAGIYTVYGIAGCSGVTSQTGYVACRLSINGGARFIPGMGVAPASNNVGTTLIAQAHDRFAASDTIELQIQQNSGSTLNVQNGAGFACRLLAVWESL